MSGGGTTVVVPLTTDGTLNEFKPYQLQFFQVLGQPLTTLKSFFCISQLRTMLKKNHEKRANLYNLSMGETVS
jgi:hypothetical protein